MLHPQFAIGAVFTVVALMHPRSTTASESDGLLELMKVLHENKTITAAQYDRLKNVLSKDAKPEQDSVKVSTKGGLKVTSGDGDFKFQFGGRLMVYTALYDQDKVDLGDGTKFRRARLFAKG